MIKTEIIFCGQPATIICDGKCEKAWGVNQRPRINFDSEDPDDFAWLSDEEVGEAPMDPGTYEGGQGKPFHPKQHNKWCVRECERCDEALRSLNRRFYNRPQKHKEEEAFQ